MGVVRALFREFDTWISLISYQPGNNFGRLVNTVKTATPFFKYRQNSMEGIFK